MNIITEVLVIAIAGIIVTGFIKSVYEPISQYYFERKILPILAPFYEQVDPYLPQWIQDFTREELSRKLKNELEHTNNRSDIAVDFTPEELEKIYEYVLKNMDILAMADKAKPHQETTKSEREDGFIDEEEEEGGVLVDS